MWTSTQADNTIADVLGLRARLRPRSDLDLIATLDAGLPLTALTHVADRVAPDDKTFRFRLVPRATLARRGGNASSAKLSPEQGAKVARLAKVWSVALDVWKDEEAARAFLWRSHALLDGAKPIDVVLKSEFGGPIVENLLRQLQHSSAV